MSLRVVLLGPPASGKGTQGQRLAVAAGVAYLSTGALLREAVEDDTPLGLQAKPILDQGGYLPDDLMCRILGQWLERHPDGWVLDGFPRSVPQAGYLDDWLQIHDQDLDRVIALEAPLEELLHRIQGRVECPECRWTGQSASAINSHCPVCGSIVSRREDDDEENFRRRHAAYTRYTLPLVEYYTARDLLSHQNATAAPDVVAAQIAALFTSPVVPG